MDMVKEIVRDKVERPPGLQTGPSWLDIQIDKMKNKVEEVCREAWSRGKLVEWSYREVSMTEDNPGESVLDSVDVCDEDEDSHCTPPMIQATDGTFLLLHIQHCHN